MNESKFRRIIKLIINEGISDGGDYPTVTLELYMNGVRGTKIILYRGDKRHDDDIVDRSGVEYKTDTDVASILRTLNKTSSETSSENRSEEDIKSILRNLSISELRELIREKIVVTNNIPNEILDLRGKIKEGNEIKMNEMVIIPNDSVQTLDQFVTSSELYEDNGVDMLGAKTRAMSSDEMEDYLDKTVGGNKTKLDKYTMPYIHRGNVEIKDEQNRRFDLDKLRLSIMVRPDKLLKQNEKITHSGGEKAQYYNIGLPALKGLAVNEKSGEFVVVDTCPGAGACKVYCYAKKGGYVQWKASSMSQTRVLNYLLNDPDGFVTKLESEIQIAVNKFSKKNVKVVIRWHDAGDFFSPNYVRLAYNVARKFPQVDFYAYTKMASVAIGEKPDNFKINFSMGASADQEKQIKFNVTKHSTVVPKDMFTDLILKDDDGKLIRDADGKMQFKSLEAIDVLKDKLAKKYNVDISSIITYDEMKDIPVGDVPKYNVIVKPGDGDESANRADVIGTWLLIH